MSTAASQAGANKAQSARLLFHDGFPAIPEATVRSNFSLRPGRHAHKNRNRRRDGGHPAACSVFRWDAAGAHKLSTGMPPVALPIALGAQRFSLANHRTGIALVDDLPEARPGACVPVSRGSAADKVLLSAAVMNPPPGLADEIKSILDQSHDRCTFSGEVCTPPAWMSLP